VPRSKALLTRISHTMSERCLEAGAFVAISHY
jgi:hypothetical protein